MLLSHGFDRLFKFAFLIGLVALLTVSDFAPHRRFEGVDAFLAFGAAFLTLWGLGWLVVWRPVLGPAATWLYIWRTFGLKASWSDARNLRVLFEGKLSADLHWYPCTDVAQLPIGERLPTLRLRAVAVHAAEVRKGSFLTQGRDKSWYGRALMPDTYAVWTVTIVAGMLPIFTGAFVGRGPLVFLSTTRFPTASAIVATLVWAIGTWVVAFGFDRALGRSEAAARAE